MAAVRNSKRPKSGPGRKRGSKNRWRKFSGEALRTIAFPLGGIGTGNISLDGYGQLRDWEIFNRPGKGEFVPYSFFAIWARPQGKPAVARVLEARRPAPYEAWNGLNPGQVYGLPRFARSDFEAMYPFAKLSLNDPALPIRVELESFTPFIPLNEKDSSLPVAVLRYKVTNRTSRRVAVSVVGSLLNVVGYHGRDPITGRQHPSLGHNRNRLARQAGVVGLKMTSDTLSPTSPGFGSMAIATTHTGPISYLTHWGRGAHWDDCQRFWDDFSDDGTLQGDHRGVSHAGEGEHGSLAAGATLGPRSSETFTFLISWHFPNRAYDRNPVGTRQHFRLRNWYADRFTDAWHVVKYTAHHLERLENQSRLYVDTLTESTLPEPVLDAASSQACIIRTNTFFRTNDGKLFAYEGCRDQSGSCPMNCTHVFNYEQTLAHLFGSLERTMRDTDFDVNTRLDGNMAFRTLLPLSARRWNFKPAADGQMGTILKLYREWKLSGDRAFLARHWPAAKRAMAFAWTKGGWDGDRDGVMEGEQHNTYDIEFYGPNTMMGTLYLGALKACGIMARELGNNKSAKQYEELFERGSQHLDRRLFNGEWYVQKGVDVRQIRYQFGRGCLADQLLGQWFCEVVGLGHVLPATHVRTALQSIFKNNFKHDLSTHHSVQRTYALNDEAGLLLCTWPAGGRPPFPFIYADEVWTGIEYQVAAHLIYEGLVTEGLTIVEAVRDRYDGAKRNPFNEIECGHHYARAMASWSLITALSGYRYTAAQQYIGFSPRITPERFACFFSTGSGWGLFKQIATKGQLRASLALRYGRLSLKTMELVWPESIKSLLNRKVVVKMDRSVIPATVTNKSKNIKICLGQQTTMTANNTLTVLIK